MARKTKPIYLFIAGVLLLLVALIFAFLLLQAYNANAVAHTATADEEPKYNNQYIDAESTAVVATQPKSSSSQHDYVINAKGLCADSKGRVYDSEGIEYSVLNNCVAVVYEGNVYKISVGYIQKVNPLKEKKKTSSKVAETVADRIEESQKSNESSRSHIVEEPEEDVSTGISISQSQNISRPSGNGAVAQSNVKMSYKALTVKKDSLFSLVLNGADASVSWQAGSEIIEIYQKNGNQCSFKAVETGTTQVVAVYKGESYYCSITIT